MHFELLHTSTPSKADHAKTRLLEAGLYCFAARGLDGVTIREIATHAGQNSAAITYYFGSKEGLYHAVLDAVMRFFKSHVQTAQTAYALAQATGGFGPQQALVILKQIQRNFALGVLQDSMTAQFAQLMVREQTQPTSAFEALYSGTSEPLHLMLSHLVSIILGTSPDAPEAVLRAHALIGQMQAFTMGRETLLRRMKWTDYANGRAQQIADMLDQNLDIFIAGLTARGGR